MESHALAPLSRWGKIGLGWFCVLLLAFGAQVENRTVFLERRMGDLDVFLRAAWAVRTGADPYAVTSDNDWHYLYPPLYAILLTPLADPPPGEDTAGFVPYAWSVAICYLLSVLCLLAGVHALARALEERSDDPSFRDQPRYCRRWWMLRMAPILVCLLPIGHTLMRGQVNLLILATLCAALAGWLRGRNFRAGAWLAFAICIKVIPAYLLVYPLWKRDLRALLGCGVGLAVGLVVIPVLVFGPVKTQTHYQTYAKVFFGPIFRLNDDDSLKKEILGVNATDSVGVKNAVHNWLNPNRDQRPEHLSTIGKITYISLGFVMTFLTLWPRAESRGGSWSAHPFAALIVLMTIFSPVCHSHYLMFCLPIVMSILAAHWRFQETIRISTPLKIAFTVFFTTMAVAYLPGLEILKDRCAALFATVPLWAIPVAQLWQRPPEAPATPTRAEVRQAA